MTELLYPLPSYSSQPPGGASYQPDFATPLLSDFIPKPVSAESRPTPEPMATDHEDFDASKHLTFEMPEVVTMEEIGYAKDIGISPVAVSKPFQLFSKAAVEQMRREVFDVRENHPEHTFKSNLAVCQVRGYAPKHAPFTYDAWTHPETLAAISKVAGVDLVPWGNYEIAHINFSQKSTSQVAAELAELEIKQQAHADDEGIGGCPHEDDKPIVGWHKDSYPFVAVLMMSDCTNMIGGETALLQGDGGIRKIRGPSMGCAAVLQGRYITHQAMRALGATERITAVTSFRPRSPFIRDDSILNTVRPISDLSSLYFEYSEYRMEMLVDRFQNKLKQLRKDNRAGKKTKVRELKAFMEEQQKFLDHMDREIVDYEHVIEGVLPQEDMPEDALTVEEDASPKRKRVL